MSGTPSPAGWARRGSTFGSSERSPLPAVRPGHLHESEATAVSVVLHLPLEEVDQTVRPLLKALQTLFHVENDLDPREVDAEIARERQHDLQPFDRLLA